MIGTVRTGKGKTMYDKLYDELVERLRAGSYTFEELSIILPRAADAIEELCMKLHGDEAAISGMKREIERMVVSNTSNMYRITQDERERIVSWLGKFCRHIDNFDISLNDDENTEFFKEKMYQQFGWEKTSNCGARMEDEP